MTDLHFGDDVPDHPSSEELAAYLNGSLGMSGREALEAHLFSCRECRLDLTSTRRLLQRHRARRRALTMAPVAVAAALAFVVISRARPTDTTEDERLRAVGSAGSDTAASIRIVAPQSNATIDARTVVFVWRSEPGRPLYQLTLTDDRGVAVWSVETMDTTAALPASVPLERGGTYFWTVDALAADGRSLTTRAQRFSTAR